MTRSDVIYLGLIAGLLVIDHAVLWRRFTRQSLVDPGRARLVLWSAWALMLWSLTTVGIVLWWFRDRAWETLRFSTPQGWRLWAALGLVAALSLAFARRIVRVARSRRRGRVRFGSPAVARLVPHTVPELAAWLALSLSAGFCEEFLFRGYLIWAFQPSLGLLGAAALSVVVFGLAHAYQGTAGIIATGLGAIGFTVIVIGLGSLWPAIIAHCLLDISQGLVGFLVAYDGPVPPPDRPRP